MATDVAGLVADSSLMARAGRGVLSTLTGRRPAGTSSAPLSMRSGAAELVALSSAAEQRRGGASGVRTVVGSDTGRVRLARALVGPTRELRVYNETEAVGWHYLHQCADLREQASGEPLLCCVQAAKEDVLYLCTDVRLAAVAVSHALQLLWQVALRDLLSLDLDPNDRATLRLRASGSLASEREVAADARVVTVALADEETAERLRGIVNLHADLSLSEAAHSSTMRSTPYASRHRPQ